MKKIDRGEGIERDVWVVRSKKKMHINIFWSRREAREYLKSTYVYTYVERCSLRSIR